MSEHRSRRYRRNKQDDKRSNATTTPIILAKRAEGNGPKLPTEVKPIILQRTRVESKKEDDEKDTTTSGEGSSRPQQQLLQKTLIITRSDVAAQRSTQNSPVRNARAATRESNTTDGLTIQMSQLTTQEGEVCVGKMTRPATVISSTGTVNLNTKKVLLNNNTEFFVVGVVGTQGVGKSTILNLLANEAHDYDYYQKVFVEQDVVFPTKLKPQKCSGRSRTESTHMYITSNRLILLDSPPVMCNSYRKDMITNELDDLRNIVTLISVCHLLIVVQDDYFNASFLRLLQQAECMKAPAEGSTNDCNYFPNLLFVKNRAKRHDYQQGQREITNELLKACFKDSECRIFVGETIEQQKQLQEQQEQEQQQQQQHTKKSHMRVQDFRVNSFLLPEVRSPNATPYHEKLQNIVEELRALVFMSPRNAINTAQNSNDFTEAVWFDLLARSAQESQNHLFKYYEESQSKLFAAAALDSNGCSTGGAGSSGSGKAGINKDNELDWQDELC